MTLAQLLPQAKVLLVTTPQPAAQKVAHRAAEMASKFDLEILGVVENMSGFTTPDGSRHTIFGEGGGQLLADEIDVPLLGKVPLQEELRVQADEGVPLVVRGPGRSRRAGAHAARTRHRRRDSARAAGGAGAGDGRRTRLRRQRAARYPVTAAIQQSRLASRLNGAADAAAVERALVDGDEAEAREARAQVEPQRAELVVLVPHQPRVVLVARVEPVPARAGDQLDDPVAALEVLEVVVVAVQHERGAAPHRAPQGLRRPPGRRGGRRSGTAGARRRSGTFPRLPRTCAFSQLRCGEPASSPDSELRLMNSQPPVLKR